MDKPWQRPRVSPILNPMPAKNGSLREFWTDIKWKLCLPEYLYRPQQIVRRVRRKLGAPRVYEVVRLPWGFDLQIRLPELMSNAIWYRGIFDLISCETIWRLLDEGDLALDVGANIGYMSSLMAARLKRNGRVIAFEPHQVLFQELEANIARWAPFPERQTACVDARNTALSNSSGTAILKIPADWETNRGVGEVASGAGNLSSANDPCLIRLERLDDVLDGTKAIGLAKLDVEGHEVEVLGGAERLLKNRVIRDIVFEDLKAYPSPVMSLLEGYGYSLFSLGKGFRAPRLGRVDRRGMSRRDDPNYLATLAPERAIQRMRQRGWAVLKEV